VVWWKRSDRQQLSGRLGALPFLWHQGGCKSAVQILTAQRLPSHAKKSGSKYITKWFVGFDYLSLDVFTIDAMLEMPQWPQLK
jgi:hypothetical protein